MFSVLTCLSSAQNRATAAEDTIYETKIKPLLASKCYSCHGALKQEAGLRLETVAVMLEGGDSGAVLVPGNAEESLLIHRISASDHERMPPLEDGSAIQADDIETIKRWIREGAEAPDEELPASPTAHWAFQPIAKPSRLATASPSGGDVNPIDRLLSVYHLENKLTAQPIASREARIRRLYLDLIGLPPSREQLNDSRPWDPIVNELLASPQHAERWARHWMDVWRYSDWYGLNEQLRNSTKHLWRWRDWIVDSLYQNKPYDRMVQEMLAGDELAPQDDDVVVATGFLARNYYLFNRTTWLDDTIEHTSKAFMGLTLHCAKCHDHKYDPLSQLDYYRFRAIFEPHQVRLDPVPGTVDFSIDGLPRVFDDQLDAPTFIHIKGDPKRPDESVRIEAGVPDVFARFAPQAEPIALPPTAWAPGIREYAQADRISAAEARVDAARREWGMLDRSTQLAASKYTVSRGVSGEVSDADKDKQTLARETAKWKQIAMEAELAALKATCDADNARYRAAGKAAGHELDELSRIAATCQAESLRARSEWERSKAQGNPDKKKKSNKDVKTKLKSPAASDLASNEGQMTYASLRASQKLLETPEHKEADYSPVYPPTSTGRRLALARWLTSPDHLLTARVAVNHIWLRHMGEPLVEDVSDFGLRTPKPPLWDVLDYLAAEFIQSNWDQRHIHRLIVKSLAYQRCSTSQSIDRTTLATDPTNRFYWRANQRRMESQVVRDSLLYLAGELDLILGGPSIEPDQPNKRRGLYLKHSRDHQDKLHSAFDDADYLQCYRRSESIIPQQALALANSKLAIESSQRIADRLIAEAFVADSHADDQLDWKSFITMGYELVLGRLPSGEETAACEEFCKEQQALNADKDLLRRRSRTASRLVHALLNHNDFVTVR